MPYVVSGENKDEGHRVFGPWTHLDHARDFIKKLREQGDTKVYLHDLIHPDYIH